MTQKHLPPPKIRNVSSNGVWVRDGAKASLITWDALARVMEDLRAATLPDGKFDPEKTDGVVKADFSSACKSHWRETEAMFRILEEDNT